MRTRFIRLFNIAILLIYWYIVNYALPYSPVGWIITAESSSLDIRAKGIAIGFAVNWITNFAVAEVTPDDHKHWLQDIQLKGLTLEEIDAVLVDEVSAEDRRRECIVDQLGVDRMANAAADGGFVDERRDSTSKEVVETVET
ncbi:hypothetical protein TCE0_015r03155 [Talaromyces pinophilus]|uniref:Uncharacterized protein n=1 Tax=Talaromyces pinophilus TaxID=128442 RepID=A0A6V8H1W1_TALPI|nr:hypothetical protein TCE0_015r03155 [Talaromyces pinophilus]